jgi:esterase/lipase
METKKEYIEKEILKYQDWIVEETENYNRHIANINQDIEDVKNLSDEEYQKICERIEKEKEEFEEESSEMEKILSKVGLTIEEWDNMSIDDSSEFLFNLAKTSPTLLKELEKDFDNFYKKYPTLID